MSQMHIVYDRSGERHDFPEDAENIYELHYERSSDELYVQHWTPDVKTGPLPLVQIFYAPRRYVLEEVYE